MADFQSYAGPGDRNLPMTEISGVWQHTRNTHATHTQHTVYPRVLALTLCLPLDASQATNPCPASAR